MRFQEHAIAAKWQRTGYLYLLILPTFAFILLFAYYPSASAIYHAFFKWNGTNIKEFVGLDNFRRILFDDPDLPRAVLNMGFFLGGNILLQIPTLALALVLYHLRLPRLQYLYRTLFVLPMVVPGMVGMLLWSFIYNPHVGLLNRFLTLIGAIEAPWLGPTWLADTSLALPSVIFMGFPWVNTIALLIYLAAFQRISPDLIDAAHIDGAPTLARIWYVELPMVLGQIKLIFILSVIGAVQDYGRILIMTDGGPGTSTLVPGLLMYHRAFRYSHMGYASAIGVLMFLVILGLTALNIRYFKTHDEESRQAA